MNLYGIYLFEEVFYFCFASMYMLFVFLFFFGIDAWSIDACIAFAT